MTAPRSFWPIGIVAMLAANVSIVATMVYFALRRETTAVEPDYYERAVRWDDEARQRAHNKELGWSVESRWTNAVPPVFEAPGSLATPAIASGLGESQPGLLVTLRDALSRPLAGAKVRGEVFHAADAKHRLTFDMACADPFAGTYAAALAMTRPGLWRLSLVVVRAGDRFTLVRMIEVPAPGEKVTSVHDAARVAPSIAEAPR